MKLALFILLTLLTPMLVHGEQQSRGGGGGNGGTGVLFLGGFSFAHNRSMNAGVVDTKMGMNFGLGIEFRVLSSLALEIDFLIAQKNYESILSSGLREAYYLTYFETPVLVKWLVTPHFHLKVGPYLGSFLISATRESNGGEAPVKSEFKNDYGATFGLWLGMPAKKNLSLGLDIRYDLGIADVQNDGDPSSALYTRALMTLFTVVFHFK